MATPSPSLPLPSMLLPPLLLLVLLHLLLVTHVACLPRIATSASTGASISSSSSSSSNTPGKSTSTVTSSTAATSSPTPTSSSSPSPTTTSTAPTVSFFVERFPLSVASSGLLDTICTVCTKTAADGSPSNCSIGGTPDALFIGSSDITQRPGDYLKSDFGYIYVCDKPQYVVVKEYPTEESNGVLETSIKLPREIPATGFYSSLWTASDSDTVKVTVINRESTDMQVQGLPPADSDMCVLQGTPKESSVVQQTFSGEPAKSFPVSSLPPTTLITQFIASNLPQVYGMWGAAILTYHNTTSSMQQTTYILFKIDPVTGVSTVYSYSAAFSSVNNNYGGGGRRLLLGTSYDTASVVTTSLTCVLKNPIPPGCTTYSCRYICY